MAVLMATLKVALRVDHLAVETAEYSAWSMAGSLVLHLELVMVVWMVE